MTGKRISRREAAGAIVGLAAGSVAVIGARPFATLAPQGDPIPAPPFTGAIDKIPRADILSYGASIAFDSSPHASTYGRLFHDRSSSLVRGPEALIEPAAGILNTSDLQLASGRIVARVTVDADWAHQAFSKGVNYIWFDGPEHPMRMATVPGNADWAIGFSQIRVLHKGYVNTKPLAKWLYDESTRCVDVWMHCGVGCCTAHGSYAEPIEVVDR